MTIGFDVAAYIVTENSSSVSVSASVQSGFLARDVVVTVQTVDGTATGGDYSLATQVGGYCNHTYPFGCTLSFLAGDVVVTMNGTTTGGTVIFTLSHRWKVIQECIQDSKMGGGRGC